MFLSGEIHGGAKPPKPQTRPNADFTPILKNLVAAEQSARFRARPKVNIDKETWNKNYSTEVNDPATPLKVDQGSLAIKKVSPQKT